jgi:hypothetical protein
MVWTDVSFRTLTQFAIDDDNSALHNSLLTEALLNGYVATQVLAIRRLVDRRSDVISLPRLLRDLKSNFALITRENYVCFDGLPYDYEAVQHRDMMTRVPGRGFWAETTGPNAYGTSEMTHAQFDRLSGINPKDRTREDRLRKSLLATVEKWLDDSGADELAEWSHAYLAHASNAETREKIAEATVTMDKIADATKALARVTEAISGELLHAGGRLNALMPTAQFDQFEKLDSPIMRRGRERAADELWRRLSDERDGYLAKVADELIRQANSAK